MAHRAMNNQEKAAAAILKAYKFDIFYSYTIGNVTGYYWAIHPKLICQYCINTASEKAINDLLKIDNETKQTIIDNVKKKSPQLTIF